MGILLRPETRVGAAGQAGGAKVQGRLVRVVGSLLAVAFVVCATVFVGWSSWPADVTERVVFVVYAMALVGIPLGIWFGTQEKFYL